MGRVAAREGSTIIRLFEGLMDAGQLRLLRTMKLLYRWYFQLLSGQLQTVYYFSKAFSTAKNMSMDCKSGPGGFARRCCVGVSSRC